jgi:hypothetical protein
VGSGGNEKKIRSKYKTLVFEMEKDFTKKSKTIFND